MAIALGITADQSPASPLPEDDRLAQLWADRTGQPAQELLVLWQQSQKKQRLSDGDLLVWVKKSQRNDAIG